ncbi:hypothetical protein [Prevotella nigrescens]|uniref:hypothetical protein n=1 Tax=Prevotella nigrescens TaxID=28133 RepID=UPI0036200C71
MNTPYLWSAKAVSDFLPVIDKAKFACENSGQRIEAILMEISVPCIQKDSGYVLKGA